MIETAQELGHARAWLSRRGRERSAGAAAAVERDGLREAFLRAIWVFLDLLGDAIEPLAPVHFRPDFLGLNPGLGPQNHQMIKQVGAFPDDFFPVAGRSLKCNLGGLFRDLLGNFKRPGLEQACGARTGRILAPGGAHTLEQAADRITHGAPYPASDRLRIPDNLTGGAEDSVKRAALAKD
jgi:hypothetical protein